MKHEIEYRGKELIDKLKNIQICICGVGALGSNLTDSLVRMGCERIKVIDFDRVEPHNINNQIYDKTDNGNLKVAALQRKMYNVSGLQILTENKKLETSNIKKFLRGADIVVDCFDNSASRKLVTLYTLETKTPCIHAGLLDDYGEVVWNEKYRVPNDVKGDVCDYPLARNLIDVIVAITSEEVVHFVETKEKRNWGFSLKGMKILCL